MITPLFIRLPATSAPYIGLELGNTSLDGDVKEEFTGNRFNMNSETSETNLSAFVGYQFNQNCYRQFELEDSLSTDTLISETVYLEEKWEESVEVKQFSLMLIYSYPLNEKWNLKGGLGLTYTQYEQSS